MNVHGWSTCIGHVGKNYLSRHRHRHPALLFERGRRGRQRSVWGQVLSQIKITLCNRRRGGPCGGAEGDGSEDLHTEYGVKHLSKPRRGGGRGHYLNVRVILI